MIYKYIALMSLEKQKNNNASSLDYNNFIFSTRPEYCYEIPFLRIK